MTIHDLSAQLYDLTRSGYVNGEKFSKAGLENAIRAWMREPQTNKIPNTVVVELSLPDGSWLASIHKYADAADGYDYTIPENREEEARLWEMLTA